MLHYLFNPIDCGTSVDLNGRLPTLVKNIILPQDFAFGVHFEEGPFFFAILLSPILLVCLVVLFTIWFIPFWLERHPADLQNATTPLLVALAIVSPILSLAFTFMSN